MRSERRRAREAAMRALYQMDMSGCTSEDAISYAVSSSSDLDLPERAQGYASQLVCAAVERMTEIDAVMAGIAHDWAVQRMSPTDRNIMRIAVCEMLYLKDVPVATAIDEAVEIAKLYGTADSPRFVNGILGALAERIKDGQGPADGADAGEGRAESSDAASSGDVEGDSGGKCLGGAHEGRDTRV